MTTAQETYKDFVKLGLRPPLRDLGFRGSGTTFVWPSPIAYAQIGLQKNKWSTREMVSFTANVSFVTHEAWEQARRTSSWLPKKPSANVHGEQWYERIGHLMGRRIDLWWELRADEEWHPLAAEVVSALEKYALPELIRRTAHAAPQ